jgi:hypothetical protein
MKMMREEDLLPQSTQRGTKEKPHFGCCQVYWDGIYGQNFHERILKLEGFLDLKIRRLIPLKSNHPMKEFRGIIYP